MQYHDAMKIELESGHRILSNNGSSLDAVIETITVLEDCHLFNAGKGSVFTH